MLDEQLRLSQAAAAAYEGVPDAAGLRVAAQARVRRLEAAVRDAGGTPSERPAAGRPASQPAPRRRERALRGHVAAVGQLEQREWRELLAGLIAGTASSQSALLGRLGRPPVPTAFPGQPV